MTHLLNIAEAVGFEPTWQLPAKRISSAPRYDHFDTPPNRLPSATAWCLLRKHPLTKLTSATTADFKQVAFGNRLRDLLRRSASKPVPFGHRLVFALQTPSDTIYDCFADQREPGAFGNRFIKQKKGTSPLAGLEGFEPPNAGIRIQCLTAWRKPNRLRSNATECII